MKRSRSYMDSDGDRKNEKKRSSCSKEDTVDNERSNDELVVYRILCPDGFTSSMIGKNRRAIKSICQKTGAKVKLLDLFPGAKDRVITISSYVKNKDEIDVDNHIYPLCPAQDALIKVHEAISNAMATANANAMASDGNSDRKYKQRDVCRILVPSSQVAYIIGKSGSTIKRLRSETSAYIEITLKDPNDPTHSCARDFDNFFQIIGNAENVKKALFALSAIMFKFAPKESILLPDVPQITIPSDPVGISPAVDSFLPSESLSSMLGDYPELQGNSSRLPVASGSFKSQDLTIRVLCPSNAIGRVIGNGGSSLKSVRQATGARIEVDDAKDNPEEFIITVIATEAMDDSKSMAVDAVLMLQGKINDEDELTVCIRLLVPKEVIHYIVGKSGSIVKHIRNQTRAYIRISKTNKPSCADPDDHLVEVFGEVGSVRDALVQLILRLREYVLFHDKEGNRRTSSAESADLSAPPVHPPHLLPVHLSYSDTATALALYLALSQSITTNYGYGFSPRMGNNECGYNTWNSSNLYGGLPQMLVSPHAVSIMTGEGGTNVDDMHMISGAAIEVSESNSSHSSPVALISERGSRVEMGSSVEMIKWSRPPIGKIKINTDGGTSFFGWAGYGGLARDHNAKWIEGFCGKISGCANALCAELWGIRQGFRLASKKGWKNAIIETDSGLARNLVLRNQIISNHPDQDIIDDCIGLMKETGGTLVHVKREGNRCADILARVGVNQERTIVEPFNELITALMYDEQGREYPRGS